MKTEGSKLASKITTSWYVGRDIWPPGTTEGGSPYRTLGENSTNSLHTVIQSWLIGEIDMPGTSCSEMSLL